MHRTRRELVAGAVPLAGLALVPNAWAARLLDRTPRVGPGAFADSVASGDPSPSAVSFWSRLTTDRPRSGARLIVAEDEGLRRVVAETVVPTGRAMDHCLKARVGGLQPGTTYYYAWVSGDEASPTGRTRTAPAPDSRDAVRIAVSSCQNFSDGFYTGLTHMAAQPDLDLVLFLGDYTYETEDAGTRNEPGNTNDLASYRERLRLNRTDVGLRELHRLHPTAHIWDDHEIADNYTDNAPQASELQRTAGYRASFEWMPRMTFPEERYRTYKPLPLGGVAEVILLDERQYRTGDGNSADNAPRPFLGRTQLDVLKARLKNSPSRWKVIANQLPTFPINGVAQLTLQNDQWEGFQAERDELLAFIRTEAIENVVFVTGDIHTFITSEVAEDFTDLATDVDGAASIAVDYVCGSVTSTGFPSATETAVTAASPHIKQFNGTDHGYGHLLLDDSQLVTEYRAGPIDRPNAPVGTIERFVQPAGAATFSRSSSPAPSRNAARAAQVAATRAGVLENAKTTSVAAARRKSIARHHRKDLA